MKVNLLSICIALVSFNATSDDNLNDLFDLSLEQLLAIELSTGSLKKTGAKESASAVTLIRKEQIKYSSAKNLTSLLEQYVPGLLVMAHSEGDKIGLRGHIAAENYKLLLLVNGKNVTNVVYEGAITEIDQWELHDIEQVEVIRGPGSVTYGSGAIAGVINIITKSAQSKQPKFELNLSGNSAYQNRGGSLQYNDNIGNIDLYSFLSYRKTEGYENPNYFVLGFQENSDLRYLGKKESNTYSPQDYLSDTFSRPQIKAHIDLNYGDNINFWARYTQSGQSHHFVTKTPVLNGGIEQIVNGRQVGLRSFISSVNHDYEITDTSSFANSLTYNNQEYIRWNKQNTDAEWESPDNIKDYAFSQERITASSLYHYSGIENLTIITGFEYTHIEAGAPWHKNKDHLWIREGVHLISDFNTSVYTQNLSLNGRPTEDRSVAIGSGIAMYNMTHLLETTFKFSKHHQVRFSHRYDKPNISDAMYSPRLSLISHLDDDNTIVVTAQRALRMMPLRAQYLVDTNNIQTSGSEHESIDGVELSVLNQSIDNTSLNASVFYNDINAVGYTGSELQFLSDFSLIGLDVELNYKYQNIDFIINHAYLNAFNVKMNESLKTGRNRNNISFSDYFYQTRSDIPLTLEGYGSGLNNIPENITKLILTAKFLDNTLVAQVNSQIYWHYNGSYDEMRMYQHAYDTFDVESLSEQDQTIFANQQREFENERRLLDANDAYKLDYSLNMSLTYHWLYNDNINMNMSFYIDNITNAKKTYYVSTGSSGPIPDRLKYLEQPTTIGINISFSY